MKEQLQTFLEIATEAALAGGTELQNYLGKIEDSIVEKGRPGDLVTAADKASEAIILDIFSRHLPQHAILSEESGELGNQNNRYLWAIDPLDGTTNFAHQYPAFAVSIGLLIDGIPAVGVIYDPFHNELFRAAKDLGATCDKQSLMPETYPYKIRVSQNSELSKSLLVTGFAYDRRETSDNNYAEFCHFTHLTQGVRRSGSASLDLAYVACGRVDGYWERGISPWDMAAGIIILRESGGKVTAYDNSPLNISSGRILATNGYIHNAVSQELMNTPPLSTWGKH